MQFVLLGANGCTFAILDALEASTAKISVAGWFDSDDVGDRLAMRFPQAVRIGSADQLSNLVVDKILIVGQGGDLDKKEELLRGFARDGVPMILDQPVCSGIFAVELDMIQRDTKAAMIPFHPPSHHPAIARAAQWTQGKSPIGPIKQVAVDRSLVSRTDSAVRTALAQDGLLLRRLLGNFQRVGAMPSKELTSLANLSVQLTSEVEAVGRWSVSPINAPAGATLSLHGEYGNIMIWMPDVGDWTITSTSEDIQEEQLSPPDLASYGRGMIDSLSQAPFVGSAPNWEDAVRAADFSEVACESARKGKILPISNQRLTEEDTFKSLMAAGGCLILLALPILLLAVSVFDGLAIPVRRTVEIEVVEHERSFHLPGDFAALISLSVVGKGNALISSRELSAASRSELFAEYGNDTEGLPSAYHLSRNDITFAPAADDKYVFQMDYEGAWRVWSGWPFLLLVPLSIFLTLQLLKLAFPKVSSKGVES